MTDNIRAGAAGRKAHGRADATLGGPIPKFVSIGGTF
jgi:hypothetical protein